MTMYGGDSVNEVLWTYMDVTAVPQSLPGQTPVSFGNQGFQGLYPSGPRQGQPFNPSHAYIVVETGAVRLRCDGVDPDPGLGTLYTAGQVIDWSSPLGDYQGMMRRARVVRDNSSVATRLSISYRN